MCAAVFILQIGADGSRLHLKQCVPVLTALHNLLIKVCLPECIANIQKNAGKVACSAVLCNAKIKCSPKCSY